MMKPQRGNILFLILLAIILFVALAYAVNSGTRGGTKSATEEKAQAAAAELIQYTTLLGNTINRLLLVNGCKETEISFENPIVTTYVNASAPAKCKLFDPAGGGMAFKTIPAEWLNSNFSGSYDYGYFGVYDQTSIFNVGLASTGTGAGIDLVMLVPYLNDNVCLAINKMAGTGNIPNPGIKIADINDGRHFKGYYWNINGGYGFTAPVLPNYGCFYAGLNTTWTNTAYFLLLAR